MEDNLICASLIYQFSCIKQDTIMYRKTRHPPVIVEKIIEAKYKINRGKTWFNRKKERKSRVRDTCSEIETWLALTWALQASSKLYN